MFCAGCIRQNVTPPSQACGRTVLRTIDRRHRLTTQHEHRRRVVQLQYYLPGLRHLVCIRWPDHDQTRHGAHVSEMFDRLMRWAILAKPNGIVGEHVNDREFHQGA